MAMDYSTMAEGYARNRRVSDHVIAELRSIFPLDSTSRVLEVGCGTANHIHALVRLTGCMGWGVEPSREMRQLAPTHPRLSLCEGTADSLPFEDASFDLVFSVNVIHHVSDPLNYFKEALRVLSPGGSICTGTDSPDMIRRREPLSRYWPSSATADMARYHPVDMLLKLMSQAGFVETACREVRESGLVIDSRPYRERAFSCLRLISEAEFQAGIHRLEEDLRRGPVASISEYVCIWGKASDTQTASGDLRF